MSNLLLQVLDEGHLTDNKGRRVDFRNAIIIMTSNIAADVLAQHSQAEDDVPGFVRSEVMKHMQHAFAPEFINRIDDIVGWESSRSLSF